MSDSSAIRVIAISGTGEKSPACFLIETPDARLLLDLGEQGGKLPDLTNVGAIDAVLVSHGHADHIGGLHLVDQVGTPPICSPECPHDRADRRVEVDAVVLLPSFTATPLLCARTPEVNACA